MRKLNKENWCEWFDFQVDKVKLNKLGTGISFRNLKKKEKI